MLPSEGLSGDRPGISVRKLFSSSLTTRDKKLERSSLASLFRPVENEAVAYLNGVG
jgi:hypothetical protein